MKNKLFILLIFFSSACSRKASLVLGDREGWHKIGELTVDFKKEKDEIVLLGSNRFAKLQLMIIDAPIDLLDMEVYYENGRRDDISLKSPMMEDKKSRIIDVKGLESSITKVAFVYKTRPNSDNEKAILQLWGYKTNVDELPPPEKKKVKDDLNNANPSAGEVPKTVVVNSDNTGWSVIASTHVDFKKDSDEVKILGKDTFKQIKLKVTDASIELDEAIVYFENDATPQKIKIQIILKEGDVTRPLDLEGRNKPINKIIIVYKTIKNQDKERAEVQIWGLK